MSKNTIKKGKKISLIFVIWMLILPSTVSGIMVDYFPAYTSAYIDRYDTSGGDGGTLYTTFEISRTEGYAVWQYGSFANNIDELPAAQTNNVWGYIRENINVPIKTLYRFRVSYDIDLQLQTQSTVGGDYYLNFELYVRVQQRSTSGFSYVHSARLLQVTYSGEIAPGMNWVTSVNTQISMEDRQVSWTPPVVGQLYSYALEFYFIQNSVVQSSEGEAYLNSFGWFNPYYFTVSYEPLPPPPPPPPPPPGIIWY